MAVSEKMKTVLRRTMGGQNTGDAPFNAASQGGYRNMAKQIAGGAKMSAGGLARAQQGVASQSLGAPITADDTTKEAAGLALQRQSGSPAALDAAAQRRLGQAGGSLSPGVMAQQAGQRSQGATTVTKAASPAVAAALSPTQAAGQRLQAAIPNMTGQTFTKGLTPGLNIDMSTAKFFGGAGGLSPGVAAALSPVQEAGQRLQGATTATQTLPGSGANTSNYGLPGLDTTTLTGEGELPAGYGVVAPGAQLGDRRGATSAADTTGATFAGVRGAGAGARTTEGLVEQAIRDLLMGGLRDTTAEENLAREMMQAQQQQALVDQRARAGRAGLVQTGAQAGIEADIRQQAAQAALREIMDIQAGARGEQRADIGLAGQLYGMDKALAAEEARTAAILQALQSMYGQGDNGGDNGGWITNPLPVGDENTQQTLGPQSEGEKKANELGFDLSDAEEGNIFDRLSWDNTRLFSYTDESGKIIAVYQRPNGSYFYQDESMAF